MLRSNKAINPVDRSQSEDVLKLPGFDSSNLLDSHVYDSHALRDRYASNPVWNFGDMQQISTYGLDIDVERTWLADGLMDSPYSSGIEAKTGGSYPLHNSLNPYATSSDADFLLGSVNEFDGVSTTDDSTSSMHEYHHDTIGVGLVMCIVSHRRKHKRLMQSRKAILHAC